MKVKILGLGGCGRNVLNELIDSGFPGEYTAYLDTDTNALCASQSANNITLAKEIYRGLNTGGNPGRGRSAAEISKNEIRATMDKAELVILIAGLGGGCGTGAIPVVADLIRNDAKAVAIVTTPAQFEPQKRKDLATDTIATLIDKLGEKNVHIINIQYTNLATTYPNADKLVVDKINEVLKSYS